MIKFIHGNRILYVVMLAGLIFSAVITWDACHKNKNVSEEFFNRVVDRNYHLIEQNIRWQDESLMILAGFFNASEKVTQEEYDTFVKSLYHEGRQYRALGWMSVGNGQTTLTHLFAAGGIDTDHLLGDDMGSHPDIAEHLETASDKKSIHYVFGVPRAFAGSTGFARDHDSEADFLTLYAVYPHHENSQPVGYSFSILNLHDIIEKAIATGGKSFVHVKVSVMNKDGIVRELYQSRTGGVREDGLQVRKVLTLDDKKLILDFLPSRFFVNLQGTHATHIAFYSMCAVLLLTVLFLVHTKKYMAQLSIEREKAENANRLKDDFLATMSHEIRSPMSGVLGMAELLMSTNLSGEQKGYTRTILSSGETLMNIIEDILDFSKIEANRLSLDPVPVNMMDIVDNVCALYSPKAREKAIELAVRYVPGTEQFVHADPVRVQQMLGNLVNNAIKFTEKGYVLVTVAEDDAYKMDDATVRLKFMVQDTGIGISEEAQTRIFDKFMQAETSTTRDYGGTGLGLSICRRLAEMMDGTIDVTSRPRHGSAFVLSIPFRRNLNERQDSPRPVVLKNLRTLIVDDLDVFCTLIHETLEEAGMVCDTVNSSEEALLAVCKAAATGNPYQMILIDYLLPGMNGELLARALSDMNGADDNDIGDPCLVMVTSAGAPLSNKEIVKKGFSAHLSKPLRRDMLINTLALVWQHYQAGERDTLIRVDGMTMWQDKDIDALATQMLTGRRILVAEDSRINQAFVEDVLMQLGCTVKIVVNGREAVAAVLGDDYDVVLMDCQMPVMDGFEAARQITALKKENRVRADLPVIALTANAMKGDRQKCLDAGMHDYLSKPVRTRDLAEKVRFWIARQNRQIMDETKVTLTSAKAELPIQDMAENVVLDQGLLAQAKAMMKGKFEQMVDYYCEDVMSYLQEIETAFDKGEWQEAVRPAHTIKSTSLRMGAVALSVVAKKMEAELNEVSSGARKPDKDKLRNDFDHMRELFARTESEMRHNAKAA
jgi:signal transduction histidine kinase/DNA-binding response OmpR family regulator